MMRLTEVLKQEMTEEQKEIVEAWTKPVEADGVKYSTGCSNFLLVPSTQEIVCIQRYLYTVAISVIADKTTLKRRYCYNGFGEATSSMLEWLCNSDDMEEPENYIVRKP